MKVLDRKGQNIRRALKYNAVISNPVSVAQYHEIMQSGPCVYCGAIANSVDHIMPLTRNGYEDVDNLVPACTSCNSSKNNRLLTEWDIDRVKHAIDISPKVLAVWLYLNPNIFF